MFSKFFFLSCIDPHGRPTVTVGSDRWFHICCPSVCPHFSKSSKTKQTYSSENNVHYWPDWGSCRVDHWWRLSCFSFCSSPISRHHRRKCFPFWVELADWNIVFSFLKNEIPQNYFLGQTCLKFLEFFNWNIFIFVCHHVWKVSFIVTSIFQQQRLLLWLNEYNLSSDS